MKAIARQALISLPSGGILLALLWLTVRLLPPLGMLLYFPTVVGLEVLEDQGYATLQGSPDGWPIPTDLGLWIAGAAWWPLCSLTVLIVLQVKSWRAKRYGGAI
ncbi:hypothetical protein GCM10027431_26990 [Lysobacter rhizosphaerae]